MNEGNITLTPDRFFQLLLDNLKQARKEASLRSAISEAWIQQNPLPSSLSDTIKDWFSLEDSKYWHAVAHDAIVKNFDMIDQWSEDIHLMRSDQKQISVTISFDDYMSLLRGVYFVDRLYKGTR